MSQYLQRLTAYLVDRASGFKNDFRERHSRWIRDNQNPDGGFSGREGGSDIYYTGFALRSLAVLEGLTPEVCEKAAKYLENRMTGTASAVDLFSFLVSAVLVHIGGGPNILAAAPADWPDRVANTLETFRNADGGYMKSPEGLSGSTYTTFLVAMALELLEKKIPDPERVVTFLDTRHRDGGFVEIKQMKRAGTNPTAAGIGTLQILERLTTEQARLTGAFLLELQSDFEGGLRANDRIPAADLLSTFTGCWTLHELGMLNRIDAEAVRSYAESLEQPTGGFRGGLWDNGADVEYTFYGIGVLALFSENLEI